MHAAAEAGTMGESAVFTCPDCGYRRDLSCGGGFRSASKETAEETLRGEYGDRAKRVMEKNPDAKCSWYSALFRCTCGNLYSKDAVSIYEDCRKLYGPSSRCELCGRKMWEIVSLPMSISCPECGHTMDCEGMCLWDRSEGGEPMTEEKKKEFKWVECRDISEEEIARMLEERPGGNKAGRGDSEYTQEYYEKLYGIKKKKE